MSLKKKISKEKKLHGTYYWNASPNKALCGQALPIIRK